MQGRENFYQSMIDKQFGVSLIEVLVTALVLGVGLLGVAALQVSSISSNQEGFYVSQATSIAEDLAARIRASKVSTTLYYKSLDYRYDDYVNAYKSTDISCEQEDVAPPICRGKDVLCNLTAMAASDHWEICKIADATLPEGKVKVIKGNESNHLKVVVDWRFGSSRKDLGNKVIVNSRCDVDRNCVIVELMP